MKLQARIAQGVDLKVDDHPQSIIVEFTEDKSKQRFEIMCYDFDPYQHGIRKWDIWELNVKWKSEIFVDPKTGKNSYFTYLFCTKAKPIVQMQK